MTTALLAVEYLAVSTIAFLALLRWVRRHSRRVELGDIELVVSTIHVAGTAVDLRLPASPTAGPLRSDAHTAAGFARSATGAMLAGAHIAWRTAGELGEKVWRPTITTQATGPHQPSLLAAAERAETERSEDLDRPAAADQGSRGRGSAEQGSRRPAGRPAPLALDHPGQAHRPAAEPEPGPEPEYAGPGAGRWILGPDTELIGWRITRYSPRRAEIRYLVSQPIAPDTPPRLLPIQVQTVWHDGDWRVVAPPAGDWSRAVIDDDLNLFSFFTDPQ